MNFKLIKIKIKHRYWRLIEWLIPDSWFESLENKKEHFQYDLRAMKPNSEEMCEKCPLGYEEGNGYTYDDYDFGCCIGGEDFNKNFWCYMPNYAKIKKRRKLDWR